MANKVKNKQSKLQKWDWQFVAKSYLALAYIGVEEIKNKKYCKEPNFLYRVSPQIYDAKLLLIPIIWNIKHAIEIVLKAGSVTFQKKYLKTHDLNELKKELSKTLNIKYDDTEFDELAKIVDKYYQLKIFNGKLFNSIKFYDTQNDILRYPEGSKADVEIDFYAFGKITEEELDELSKDIDLINLRLLIPVTYHSSRI